MLAKDSSYFSDRPSARPKLSEAASADEFLREAFENFIEEINKPLPKLHKDDPEYKKKMEKLKSITNKRFSLEEEYAKMRQQDIVNWENKRVPRPYKEEDETDETES